MKIEIEKVEKVIKDNDERFKELKKMHGQPNNLKPTTDRYTNLCRLFSCFIGDLYKLFGDECLPKNESWEDMKLNEN